MNSQHTEAPGAAQDDAKALAWDWLADQLQQMHKADRTCNRQELAGFLHCALDASDRHQNLPPDAARLLRKFADQLGGIATSPDQLKEPLRDGLQDIWGQHIQAAR